MCTAASYTTKDHYFGRNLDLELSYNETVTITPRGYTFPFRHIAPCTSHYAMIGIATVADNYPLYYDAVNEKGLAMAGLNFPVNADYKPVAEGKTNIASFEFIQWILATCDSVAQAREAIAGMNLTDTRFSDAFPLSTLHWMLSDRSESIVVESVKDGIHVYHNPVGVMTNNPPFDKQLFSLNDYAKVTGVSNPPSTFAGHNTYEDSKDFALDAYSRGMGSIGLPGDLSSNGRFVKVAFTRMNSVSGDSESESISQFFKILGSVEQQRGGCEVAPGQYEITIYSSCMNCDKGIYYYTTYENSQITGVDMHKVDLDGTELTSYPLIKGQQIHWMN